MKQSFGTSPLLDISVGKEVLGSVWVYEIGQEYCKNLVQSMRDRIADVIKNRDYSTKF